MWHCASCGSNKVKSAEDEDENEDYELKIVDLTDEDLDDWPIDFSTLIYLPFDFDSELLLVNNCWLVFQYKAKIATWPQPKYHDSKMVWVAWNTENNSYSQWNYTGSPNIDYEKIKPERLAYTDFLTKEDLLTQLKWSEQRKLKSIQKLWRQWEGDTNWADARWLMTEASARSLRNRMTEEEKEMNSHPNRSSNWLPHRIREEVTAEIMVDLACKKCGERNFTSLAQADRHKHFCKKYGRQPNNGLFFTPMESYLIELGILGEALDNKTNKE